MKKTMLSLLSLVAVFGSIFAIPSTTEAGGGPHIKLTSSTGSWNMVEGSTMTVTATAYPVQANIKSMSIYIDFIRVAKCNNQNTCSYQINNQTLGKHSLFVSAIDTDSNYYYINGSYYPPQYFTVTARETAAPTVSIAQKGIAYTNTTSTNGVYISAQAKGTNLKILKITRSDDSNKSVSTSCERMKNLCALGIYPTFDKSEAGKVYYYYAVATDASGHVQYSEKITVKVVLKPASQENTINAPVNTLNPSIIYPNSISADKAFTLRGDAKNTKGIWGIEVRALPSWTTTPIKQRCILNGKPTAASCSMNVDALRGHSGETIKVWSIYWDATTGMGYSSPMQVLTLTR